MERFIVVRSAHYALGEVWNVWDCGLQLVRYMAAGHEAEARARRRCEEIRAQFSARDVDRPRRPEPPQ